MYPICTLRDISVSVVFRVIRYRYFLVISARLKDIFPAGGLLEYSPNTFVDIEKLKTCEFSKFNRAYKEPFAGPF